MWFVFSFCGMIVGSVCTAADEPRPVEFARFDGYSEGPVFDDVGNLFVSHGKTSVTKITPANGPFLRIEDIVKVRGIGEKTFEAIREHISVD